MICPCCGQEAEIYAHDPLTPQQREIFDYVARAKGKIVRTDDIISHIYQFRDEPEGDTRTLVSVQVGRINKRLNRAALIGILGRNGGYRLAI